MPNALSCQNLVGISDLSRDDIELILTTAKQFKQTPPGPLLQGKIMASCFFEPSTRTRLSFEAACHRLGGQVIGFSEAANSSQAKGESLVDTIRVVSAYADLLVLRHPQTGSAKLATEFTDKPIINAGDGANQHPSQTLLDLFSIQECQGRLNELNIAFVGDLKYGRTVHSLIQALCHYKVRLFFVSPNNFPCPPALLEQLAAHDIEYSAHSDIKSIVAQLDIVYMTRLQQERLQGEETSAWLERCRLSLDDLTAAKPNLKLLHPLPRLAELPTTIDNSPHAYYFQQAENGLYVRQALLSLLLK